MTVAQLAQRIGAQLVGDGSAIVKGVGTIEEAQADEITFVSDEKHHRQACRFESGGGDCRKKYRRTCQAAVGCKKCRCGADSGIEYFCAETYA